MPADVFLWDEAKNPADIVLRTSAAEVVEALTSGTFPPRRRRRVEGLPAPRGSGRRTFLLDIYGRAWTVSTSGTVTVEVDGQGRDVAHAGGLTVAVVAAPGHVHGSGSRTVTLERARGMARSAVIDLQVDTDLRLCRITDDPALWLAFDLPELA